MKRYVRASYGYANPLCDWVNWRAEQGEVFPQPIKLEIQLDKVSSDGMTRYMTIEIGGHNVTQMVANALNYKVSKARDTYGSMIVKGCGMDMGLDVLERLKYAMEDTEYPDMFNTSDYISI